MQTCQWYVLLFGKVSTQPYQHYTHFVRYYKVLFYPLGELQFECVVERSLGGESRAERDSGRDRETESNEYKFN